MSAGQAGAAAATSLTLAVFKYWQRAVHSDEEHVQSVQCVQPVSHR